MLYGSLNEQTISIDSDDMLKRDVAVERGVASPSKVQTGLISLDAVLPSCPVAMGLAIAWRPPGIPTSAESDLSVEEFKIDERVDFGRGLLDTPICFPDV
jgi:hypothetical protein